MPQSVQQKASPSEERIAVVTGSSSGFGMLTAVELARKHYRVIATMRSPERAAELRERAKRAGVAERIEIRSLDVTVPLSIEQAVAETFGAYGRIDVLVNNAGFAAGGFVEEVEMERWRQQMETNFFGLVAMTKAVIPAMRKQRSGLIVSVSSLCGRIGLPGYAPYAASKFAVEGFCESLRHELAPFGIRIALVEPGAFRTPIWKKGLAQVPYSADSPYYRRLEAIMRYSRRAGETAPDPQQVADLIGRLADTPSPHLRYLIGRGSLLTVWGKALLPWKWYERLIKRATR